MIEKFKIFNVLSKQVRFLFFLSVLVGLGSFIAEYVFSQVFVLFFTKVGFTDPEQLNSNLKFLLQDNLFFWIFVTIAIFLTGVSKAGFQIINTLFSEVFQFEARNFLIKQTLRTSGETLNLGEVNFFLSSMIPKTSDFISLVGKTIVYIIQATGLLFVCLYMSPKLFFIVILSFLIFSPLYIFVGKKQKRLGLVLKLLNEKTSMKLMSSIRNFIFIKIIGYEKKEKEALLDLNQKNIHSLKKLAILNSFLSQFPGVAGVLLMFFLFSNFAEQGYSKAMLISLFYLLFRFIQNGFQVLYCFANFNVNWPHFVTYQNYILKNSIPAHKQLPTGALSIVQKFNLELSTLRFQYTETDPELFSNLKISLKEGGFLLLKGSSGSGKSTLLMLLTGILQNYKGQISWGGVDLKEIDVRDFRHKIGYVGPEPFLFSGTIKENLTYSISDETEDKLIYEALKMADAEDFILERGDKLNLVISENGEGLSMGQKQRISLARALLRNPKVLVLDEFTANLDKETENKIKQTIKKLKGKVTIIMASHSGSFDDLCDELVAL